MILEDRQLMKIGGAGAVDPFDPALVNPASIDLRLGTGFRRQNTWAVSFIDLGDVPEADLTTELVEVEIGGRFVIHPGEFVLGSTLERLRIPHDLAMSIDGKSSLARLGLMVHITAGYFDPGFEGVGTIEMANLSPVAIVLRPGLPICQSKWIRMEAPPAHPYSGRYQGATSVEGSRYGRDNDR